MVLGICVALALMIYGLWQIGPLLGTMTAQDNLILATWTMAAFTIVLAVFTLLQQRATQGQLRAFREAQTWDRLRLHSQKLDGILLQWVELVGQIKPLKLATDPILKTDSILSGPEFEALWAHMLTGYPEYATQWNELEPAYEDLCKRTKDFLSSTSR